MKKIIALLLLVIPFSFIQAQQNSSVEFQFKSLQWLAGTWTRTNVKPGLSATEQWHLTAPFEFRGLGLTLKGSDTVFIEKIVLATRGDDIYYIADVKENKAPINFKLTSITASGFTCENPGHDFPKKIDYSLSGKTLTVVISGDGKSQEYVFTRT